MKIFLLEDDFSLNKIIKISLENRGFFVDSFTDGYKAVDAILNSKHDLYILDLNVLGFDGHKVLEFIRKDDLNVPIIMISAEIDIENIKKEAEQYQSTLKIETEKRLKELKDSKKSKDTPEVELREKARKTAERNLKENIALSASYEQYMTIMSSEIDHFSIENSKKIEKQ